MPFVSCRLCRAVCVVLFVLCCLCRAVCVASDSVKMNNDSALPVGGTLCEVCDAMGAGLTGGFLCDLCSAQILLLNFTLHTRELAELYLKQGKCFFGSFAHSGDRMMFGLTSCGCGFYVLRRRVDGSHGLLANFSSVHLCSLLLRYIFTSAAGLLGQQNSMNGSGAEDGPRAQITANGADSANGANGANSANGEQQWSGLGARPWRGTKGWSIMGWRVFICPSPSWDNEVHFSARGNLIGRQPVCVVLRDTFKSPSCNSENFLMTPVSPTCW